MADRDYKPLERLTKVNRIDSLSEITSKFDETREGQVSKQTIQHHHNSMVTEGKW